MGERTLPTEVASVTGGIEEVLGPLGFESHPFLVDWYNKQVSVKFQLAYPPSTLATVIISRPAMFENAFLPFIKENWDKEDLRDPIDQCMIHQFERVKQSLGEVEMESLHDFQLTPQRRPRILVQTAGHVAGAVRFYRPSDFESLKEKKYYPVCHHSRWGGWFALRGVFIFPKICTPDLTQIQPPSTLSNDEATSMIELYNDHWQDWRWRDVGCPEDRYSPAQIKYFDTPPVDRLSLMGELMTLS